MVRETSPSAMARQSLCAVVAVILYQLIPGEGTNSPISMAGAGAMRLRGGFTKTMMMSMMSKDIPVINPDQFMYAENEIEREGCILQKNLEGEGGQGAGAAEGEEDEEKDDDEFVQEDEEGGPNLLAGSTNENNATVTEVPIEVALDFQPRQASEFFGEYKGKDKDKIKNHLMDVARILGLSEVPAAEPQKSQVAGEDHAEEEEEEESEPDDGHAATVSANAASKGGSIDSWIEKVNAARSAGQVENYTDEECEKLVASQRSADAAVKFTASLAKTKELVPGGPAKKSMQEDPWAVYAQDLKVAS